jgi:hypothetical protein
MAVKSERLRLIGKVFMVAVDPSSLSLAVISIRSRSVSLNVFRRFELISSSVE